MKVNELKEKSGLTLKPIAKALGIHHMTLNRWNRDFGGEIPERYNNKIKKLLKDSGSPSLAPPKSSKKKNVEKQEPSVQTTKSSALEVFRFYYSLLETTDPDLKPLKSALEEYLETKLS